MYSYVVIVVRDVQPRDAGQYTCRVWSVHECTVMLLLLSGMYIVQPRDAGQYSTRVGSGVYMNVQLYVVTVVRDVQLRDAGQYTCREWSVHECTVICCYCCQGCTAT